MLSGNGSKLNEFAHAGIRENNVDSPLHLGDGFVKTIKVGQLGDVALNARNVGADCLHSLVEFLLATARYEDIGTLFNEKFCRSETNAFRSARDDGCLAFQLFGHCLSPLLLSWNSPTPILHVRSLESEHSLADVIGEMICAAEQDGEATTRGIFRKVFLRHGRVTLEPVGRRHFVEPFRQFYVYGNPCSANLFVRRSEGLRLVRINNEGNVKLGITSFSQPQQRQHRVVYGCQMPPQVEQPVSARRYFLQNLLGREGSKKLVRPIDLRFPYFQPEGCIRAFVSHGSFSSQRLPSFSRRHSAPIRGDLI